MFVLFRFGILYSLAAACCSLPNRGVLEYKDTSATAGPKTMDELGIEMKKIIEGKNNMAHRPILWDFYIEWLDKAKKVENQWACKVNNLTNRLNEEKRGRLLFQSLINMAEWVEDLFIECWPEWAGKRNSKEYPPEYWRILFQNIENPTIMKLKVQLKKLGMSEEFFVKEVEKLLKFRNLRAHDKISDGDKEEALKNFNDEYEDVNKPYIIEILIMGLSAQSLAVDETECKKLEPDVNSITEAQRRSLRVLKFPECKPPVYDDDYFHERLKHAASTITPQAVYVTTQGTYVLYEDFKDALFAFNKRNDMQLVNGHAKHVKIIDASKSFLFKEDKVTGCFIVVKIISFRPENIVATYNIFEQNADSIDKPVAMVIQPAPERNSNADPPKITVFYCYNLEISALLIYEKCKATLKSVDTTRTNYNVTITYMSMEIIRGMRPFNSEEVDNLKKSFATTEK